MIQMSSLTKVFEQSKEQPGRYNFFNLSAKKNTEYKNWALGETFEGDGLDGTRHKVRYIRWGSLQDAVVPGHVHSSGSGHSRRAAFSPRNTGRQRRDLLLHHRGRSSSSGRHRLLHLGTVKALTRKHHSHCANILILAEAAKRCSHLPSLFQEDRIDAEAAKKHAERVHWSVYAYAILPTFTL